MTLEELVAKYQLPLAVAIAIEYAILEHGVVIEKGSGASDGDVCLEFPRRPGQLTASRALDGVLRGAGIITWRYSNGMIETSFRRGHDHV